mgnify:CR=1 FL=1
MKSFVVYFVNGYISVDKGHINMQLRLGQKFEIHSPSLPPISIQITKLGVREIEFLVTGENVENPNVPRVMPVGALVKWLSALKVVGQG